MLKDIYKKFCKQRQNEIKRIVRSEIIQDSIKKRALKCHEKIVDPVEKEINIVVSLTTFGVRINSVYMAIESIALQTVKPNKIILWLSEDHFNNENLPVTLKRLMERGLTVKYRKDIGSYTKIFYALQEFNKSLIVSIDDDIIYPNDLIENLLQMQHMYPGAICCNAARLIKKNKNGSYLPYNKWEKINGKVINSNNLIPLGVNGVLYFPDCFDEDAFDIPVFSKLCPYADDLWFKAMSFKNNVSTVVSGAYKKLTDSFIALDSADIDALAIANVINKKNDIQFQSVINKYNIIL